MHTFAFNVASMGESEAGRERVTVITLAKRAGVSPSTVSRALKDDPRISIETRRRIEALAVKAGYMPSAIARSLSGGRSGLIGLVLGPNVNPFYSELLEEAVAQAALRSLRLLLLHAGTGALEDRTAEALLHYQVDGCLITSAQLSSHAAEICADHKVPVVMVNRVPKLHASAVTCDNAGGGALLAGILLDAGHRRFAIIRGNKAASTSVERERGFTNRIADAGADATLRLEGNSTYDGGFAAGQAIARLPARKRPEAIFAVADIMAMGAIDALRAADIHVPHDIALVSFDGIAAGAWPPYALTTIRQPIAAMIGRALDLLAARLADNHVPDEVVSLRGELITRTSHGDPS